ncbi:MAG: ABC transporter ATP-binding protein, partial [Candidatus Thermoplasmatota archaeon]|nr:ABC transporter ATP-binding protein [Candidatus Thermoplasmatota archaeon]
RVEIINLIRQLGDEKSGISVLVSSHILHEIERMTKRVLMVHKGRLLAWGDMNEIRDKLDRFPHSLSISSAEDRRLAKYLINMPEVSSVMVDEKESVLRVKILKPDNFYSKLPKILAKEKISIDQLGSLDEDLESIFAYLTGGGGGK